MIRYGGLVFPDRWGAGACDFSDDRPARAVRYVPKRRKVVKKQDDVRGETTASMKEGQQ